MRDRQTSAVPAREICDLADFDARVGGPGQASAGTGPARERGDAERRDGEIERCVFGHDGGIRAG
ncbi:MAG: hypothetical protein KIS78_34905 [Labilithrix sp.]|nr:hypothetical protein [Labilithrix sp.]MCW5837635.1 hypothetical protein [Labilithrix sp.]